MIAQFEQDPETELIVMVGEIGGDEEERTAEYIAEHVTKPVVAYIAGFTAPPGKRMGHAGAIISGSSGTAQAKAEALESKGVPVGRNPTEVAQAGGREGKGGKARRSQVPAALQSESSLSSAAMSSPAPISFARGAPSPDIMPAADVRDAAMRVLDADPAGALSYGPGYGYGPLRDWIAERHGVDPGQVVLFNGSLEAGLMLFDHLVEPGDPVIVEAPSYDRTLLALEARGAELFAVPLQSDGIDVGALEVALEAGLEPAFAHIIPNFHNPAGCTLSQEKRDRLLELASEYEFLIFEDDPYRDVRFEGEELPTMLSRDTDERVVYASSFSKTIAPGVRVGYLIGPAGPDGRDDQAGRQHVHLAEHAGAGDRRASSAARARSATRSRA